MATFTPASASGPDNASELAFRPHPGAQLPLATKLVDEHAHPITLGEYFTTAPVIVVLEYLRCTSLCGVTLRTLVSEVLKGLPLEPGRDYRLLAISIDPSDTPADAAQAQMKYAGMLGKIDRGGIHFLTSASQSGVREIAEAIGFPYQYDALIDAYIHPAGFIVATPDGTISRYIEGAAITSEEMIRALGDARQNKAPGPIARLVLLCRLQGAPLKGFSAVVVASLIAANIAAGLAAFAVFVAIARRRNC